MADPRNARTAGGGTGGSQQIGVGCAAIETDGSTLQRQSGVVLPPEAFAVLRTGALQIDGLVGLLADAVVHETPVPPEVVIVALDRTSQRMSAALACFSSPNGDSAANN